MNQELIITKRKMQSEKCKIITLAYRQIGIWNRRHILNSILTTMLSHKEKIQKGPVAKYPFWLIFQKFGYNLLKNTHSSPATTLFFQLRFAKIFEKLSQKSIRQQTPKNTSRGSGLIEVIIGASLISLFLIGLVLLTQMYTRVSRENTSKIQASFLIEGGMEGMRSIRDRSWNEIQSLASSTPYYLIFENEMFIATTTAQSLTDALFDRNIYADDVYRDSFGDIVESGGTYDPDTKKITTIVSWQAMSGTRTEQASTYIVNLFE